MEKRLIFILLFVGFFHPIGSSELDEKCLNCHRSSRLPTNLMYKRYLMKYSTNKNMKRAMFKYLKEPNPENSIMPIEFFLKFSLKKPIDLDDSNLSRLIDIFLNRYDIKKRLR